MAYTIPTIEPASFRAGDTLTWKKSLADYPASTWTLSYVFYNASGKISITASADGADHLVEESTATTGAYTAGRYEWVAHVTDGTDKHQVGAGVTQVLPDLSSVTSYDGRSHARKMLDAIDAVLESRATNDDIDVVATAIGDRSMTRDKALLLKYRQTYASAVAQEQQAAAMARGENVGRIVRVRFR